MEWYSRKQAYTVGIRVFDREQRETLLDITYELADKTILVSSNNSTMDYEFRFEYAANYWRFKREWDSTRYPYKGKTLYIDKD